MPEDLRFISHGLIIIFNDFTFSVLICGISNYCLTVSVCCPLRRSDNKEVEEEEDVEKDVDEGEEIKKMKLMKRKKLKKK